LTFNMVFDYSSRVVQFQPLDEGSNMTYLESAEGVLISRERALKEMISHGLGSDEDVQAFNSEVKANEQGLYKAEEVLQWLGY
jgi:hypothetical protein